MSQIGAQADRKGDRTIRWLNEKLGVLESRVQIASQEVDAHEAAKSAYNTLKTEALTNIKKLMSMSLPETVRLIEERFDG